MPVVWIRRWATEARLLWGAAFKYAADMECALGIDDETLNFPIDADLGSGDGLEQRITRSMT